MKKFIYFFLCLLTVSVLLLVGVLIWADVELNNFSPKIAKAHNDQKVVATQTEKKVPEKTLSYLVSKAAEDYYIKKGHSIVDIIASELDIGRDVLKEANPGVNFNRVGAEIEIPIGKKRTFKNKCASFYAEKFEGKRTASGSTFRMLGAETVASKFLPLGTKIEITNLATGIKRKAVVEDRGPYIPSCKFGEEKVARTLDLSWGLAARLWMSEEEIRTAKKKGLLVDNEFKNINTRRVKKFEQPVANVAEEGLRKAFAKGVMRVTYKILSFPKTSHTS